MLIPSLDEGLQDETRINCCGLLSSSVSLSPCPQARSASRAPCLLTEFTASKSTRSIPFFNILWATLTKVDLTVHYCKPISKTSVRVAYINYTLDPSSSSASYDFTKTWCARLLDRAYGSSQRRKRIKVLINPFGGSGKAAKWFARDIEPIFAAAHCDLDVEKTAYMGQAIEIAERLDIEAYDVIASCSGDGLPHEVFNGLARKPNAAEALHKVAVVQLPCGTGNAMSWNLNGTGDCSMAALCIVKGLRTPLDLVSVTQGNKRTISFLSQSIGIVAESDLGTDNVRWMGSARFTYGFLVRLLSKTLYPCDVAVKAEISDKQDIKAHYAAQLSKRRSLTGDSASRSTYAKGLPDLRFGTVDDPLPPDWHLFPYPRLGSFYCGNMAIMAESTPFFPASLPSDGLLDLVTIDGDMGRLKAIASLLAVEQGTFFDLQHVNVRKVVGFRVIPRFGKWAAGQTERASRAASVLKAIGISGGSTNGFISIDGEKIPFEPFQVEVHQGLGTVLSRTGFIYETPGPAGWKAALESSA